MEIKITTKRGSLSKKEHSHVMERLNKLPKAFNRIEEIEAVFMWESGSEIAVRQEAVVEIKVDAEHKKDFIAKTFSEDNKILGAFDRAYHKIQSQLHKYKDKLVDHHRKEGREVKKMDLSD